MHFDMCDIARDAVISIVMNHGCTGSAIPPEVRTAERGSVALEPGIRLRAMRNVVIAGAAEIAVGMNGKLAGPAVEQHSALADFIDGFEGARSFSRDHLI